jgi:hypothetical protein
MKNFTAQNNQTSPHLRDKMNPKNFILTHLNKLRGGGGKYHMQVCKQVCFIASFDCNKL